MLLAYILVFLYWSWLHFAQVWHFPEVLGDGEGMSDAFQNKVTFPPSVITSIYFKDMGINFSIVETLTWKPFEEKDI